MNEALTESRDARALARALSEWLPQAKQADIAALVGISARQLRRWLIEGGEAPRRLRLVARLVMALRHNWTPEGVMAWFLRARRDLAGATPLVLLGDPSAEDQLRATARRGRSQHET